MARPRLILDSGALSALAKGDARVVAWLYRATQRQMMVGIPAPVLAETLTGQPRDAAVYRVLEKDKAVLPTTADIAAHAGSLRHRAARPDLTVDAMIVATAAKHPRSIVLTGDMADMSLLAGLCDGAELAIRSVTSPAS